MKRDEFDAIVADLKSKVSESSVGSAFPLNRAVEIIVDQDSERAALSLSRAGGLQISSSDRKLWALFDVTTVSAALAIKRLSGRDAELAGITTALVELWGQAEAGRCLWFDTYTVFTGQEAEARRLSLVETARVMAPEAISLAFRLSEPVTHYVDFVSKVLEGDRVDWNSSPPIRTR